MDPAFLEALRVASPVLHDVLAQWHSGVTKHDTERLELSVIRYFSRASHRCTPFGLFAGCSLVTIGDVTRLELCAREGYARKSRLDMDYVAELARVIGANTDARRLLTLHTNSTTIAVGGRLHYVETRYSGHKREYLLTAVEPTPEILDILSRAATGARFGELHDSLRTLGFEKSETDEFLTELIDTQLLVPGIEPQLTGTEAAAVLARDLEASGYGTEISIAIRATNDRLARLDASGIGNPADVYDDAVSPLTVLQVPIERAKIVQVDLYKPGPQLSLSAGVVSELIDAAEMILTLTVGSDRLAEFVGRFEERYQSLEVPLLEALDNDVGIGFPQLDQSDHFMRRAGEQMRQRELWLGDLRVRAARDRLQTVELSDADLARLGRPGRVLCDAVSVMATVIAESSAHVDRGDYRLLAHHVSGPSGARMLGRFAHLHPDLEREIRLYILAEEALEPDVVFAEIVHLPQGRVGNIAARPVLREYEISYLGRGGGDGAARIAASDLRVSVRAGRITLRSSRLGREVRPRLSSAHNYFSSSELPVYRFLAALQEHGVSGSAAWSWGLHGSAPHLPRVTRGRIVLARASWSITSDEIARFSADTALDGTSELARWRHRSSVPRYVVLVDGDNRLLVDLENDRSVRVLLDLVHGRRAATLEEMLPAPHEMCVMGPEGRYANEIIVPLIRRELPVARDSNVAPGRRGASTQPQATAIASVRRHTPGREWVYAKVYCGVGSIDYVVRTLLAPLVSTLEAEGILDRWFFIRYSDPESHLRVRFHGSAATLARVLELTSAMCAPLVTNGRVSRLAFDTYMPEVERYGGAAAIPLAEAIFAADSTAALTTLVTVGATGAPERDMVVLAGIDRYFEDADVCIPERITVLERRLGTPPTHVRQMRSTQFRARRGAVAEALIDVRDVRGATWLSSVMDRRSVRTRPLFAELRALESRAELTVPFGDLMLSLTHMWVNRMMPDGQRVESTVYDFLVRHYRSERARAAALKPTND
ncbi:MAG: Lanthionine biosynthesis protein LanB [Gemmatimonadetes bacterium]|nr:Lanthionine biosynthesis protein LanB [Gemmatimonadota bacterium]